MSSDYVDFAAIPQEHAEVDARLTNWARWSYGSGSGTVSPMFRLYRSTDAAQQYGASTASPVDKIDAERMQASVAALPSKHRQAISWCYIKRSNPRKAAQSLEVTMQGLADLVSEGREMLTVDCSIAMCYKPVTVDSAARTFR